MSYLKVRNIQLDGISTVVPNNTIDNLHDPIFGGLESNIYDGAILIIPFPLVPSLQDYKSAVEQYFYYYGR